VFTSVIEHGASPRSLGYHAAPGTLRGLLNIVQAWLMPSSWPTTTRDIVLAVLVGAVFALVTVTWDTQVLDRSLSLILGVFAATYVAVVLLSRYFVDVSVPMDGRLLAPVQAVVYVLLLSTIWAGAKRIGLRDAGAAMSCLAIAIVVFMPSVHATAHFLRRGQARPVRSAVSGAVERLPANTLIATNVPERLFLETARSSIMIPLKVNPFSGRANRVVAQQLGQLREVLVERHGVIVLFPTVVANLVSTRADLQRAIPLTTIATFPDGTAMLSTQL
jgi:hypothetical protein